ncbi:bifunctional diguanylate cyclase/phosphodiesterase [Ideonella sp. A 288]|uniref:putative bifunctional diguanylate cyclase/phosphodiesterase n=1 Tax=Ideonella sp. A 288 TaxID=1962181 RepID=UPI001303CB0F|nr:EAL domain-containing protein [Ideonella sp. A 288]
MDPRPHDPLIDALRAENEAMRSELELLRDALERIPHGMCAFSGDDRLVLANARYRKIWNLPPDVVRPGATFRQIMDATPGSETDASRSRPQPAPGTEGTRSREWQLDDGRLIEIVVSRRADGSCVALHEDVTEQREAQARISYLARHDLLTGLANRAVLREELERALAGNRRGETLALLCLDLDRFKPVNDTYGHAAGDDLLRQVAERLRGCVREIDVVGRMGGDEFTVVQRGAAQPEGSTRLGQRIIEALSHPFDVDGHVVHIGTSVGIALAPVDGDDPETLLHHGDLALYRAKSDGRARISYFEPAMNERIDARRGVESSLREAIELDQLQLLYQPRFDLRDGRIVGVEALLRWRHPQRGMVVPDEFIPLSKETGLIVPIGRWVLEHACRDALPWPPHVTVAVNVSAVQFAQSAVVIDVLHALADSGLPARRLELEITETAMVRDPTTVLTALHTLREKGVRIALDDFGSGESSLSQLRSFPFDQLKIDRSYVHDMPDRADLRAIVRGVITIAEGMGMQTTAEGVETEAQLSAVRDLGCTAAQGFLLGPPMAAEAIAALLAGA